MKQKISITLNKDTMKEIESKLEDGFFRSKSHFIEFAVKELLRK